MTQEQVIAHKMRRPFRPLTIVMSDGRRFPVEDWLQFTAGLSFVFHYDRKTKEPTFLKLADVAAIESQPETAAAT